MDESNRNSSERVSDPADGRWSVYHDREHQRKLSIWATLKSMVHEHVRATVCSPDDHRDFMQTAQPSIQWSIWIGKCLTNPLIFSDSDLTQIGQNS